MYLVSPHVRNPRILNFIIRIAVQRFVIVQVSQVKGVDVQMSSNSENPCQLSLLQCGPPSYKLVYKPR